MEKNFYNSFKILLILITILFSFLTGFAVYQFGFIGIFLEQFKTSAGLQVLIDLGIALFLVLVWIWQDAKKLGRNPIIWVLLTLAIGSFGPLFYLITRKSDL